MQIKVDEDLPRQITAILRESGYQTDSVVDQGMSGWKDAQLWEKVQIENRLLVTADKGFADVRIHPPGTHAGIILIRPDQDGIRPMTEIMAKVLHDYDLITFSGTITVVPPRGVRVRRHL